MSAALGTAEGTSRAVRLTTQALVWLVSLVAVATLSASLASGWARADVRSDILHSSAAWLCDRHLSPDSEDGTTVGEEAGVLAAMGIASESEARTVLSECAA